MHEQIRISSRIKPVIEQDGLEFRDLNADGRLDPYEDWRLTPEQRAEDLVARMSPDEKIGLMVISSRTMGYTQKDESFTSHDGVLDEQYHKVRSDPHTSADNPYEGTTQQIAKMHMRHFILRETPTGSRIANWVNAMNEVAEGSRLGIPVLVAANSKNESGGFKLGERPDDKEFTQWPGTLGLAATGDLDLISRFAEMSRQEWVASGLRKGYMYMADTATDPRWFRVFGTFGEDPRFIAEAITRLVRGLQGPDGVGRSGVALTTKHFPGGGARENGYDPHYEEGKYNAYPTPGSLEAYHLPPFQAAIEAGTSSIMPYYAIPTRERSTVPQGRLQDFEQVGFAYNSEAIRLLREMGHRGYVNSDSGVLTKMAWGVEEFSVPERVGIAVMAGTDIFADTNDVDALRAAYLRGYFSTQRLDEAAFLLTREIFALGLFDDPYVDPETADTVVANGHFMSAAAEAHRKSVVLLKNHDHVLPLGTTGLQGKKVYVELFEKDLTVKKLDGLRNKLSEKHPQIEFTTDHRDADVAVLFLSPVTGAYFEATGLMDLSIGEHSHVDMTKVRSIRECAETVIVGLNVFLPWLLDSVEPLADALIAGFETHTETMFDAILGAFSPTGRLPLTFPIDAAALAVDEEGRCASPNDVPGYAKEKYMGGRPYVYVDVDGNRYSLGHGLSYA